MGVGGSFFRDGNMPLFEERSGYSMLKFENYDKYSEWLDAEIKEKISDDWLEKHAEEAMVLLNLSAEISEKYGQIEGIGAGLRFIGMKLDSDTASAIDECVTKINAGVDILERFFEKIERDK